MSLEIFEVDSKYLNAIGIRSKQDITWKRKVHLILVDLIMLLAIIKLFAVESVQELSGSISSSPTLICQCLKSLNLMLKKNQIEAMMTSLKDLIQKENWLRACYSTGSYEHSHQ